MQLTLSQLSVWTNPDIEEHLQRALFNNVKGSTSFEFKGHSQPKGLQVDYISHEGNGVIYAVCSLLSISMQECQSIASGNVSIQQFEDAYKLAGVHLRVNTNAGDVRLSMDYGLGLEEQGG